MNLTNWKKLNIFQTLPCFITKPVVVILVITTSAERDLAVDHLHTSQIGKQLTKCCQHAGHPKVTFLYNIWKWSTVQSLSSHLVITKMVTTVFVIKLPALLRSAYNNNSHALGAGRVYNWSSKTNSIALGHFGTQTITSNANCKPYPLNPRP